MAGADYIHCENTNCTQGSKLIYAGDIDWEDRPVVYCEHCYNKLLKKIEKLEKNAKRGR
jgi:predicted Zn-dependent protease